VIREGTVSTTKKRLITIKYILVESIERRTLMLKEKIRRAMRTLAKERSKTDSLARAMFFQ
jgi:hypothetical protein